MQNDLISRSALLEDAMAERYEFLREKNGNYDHYTDGFEDAMLYVEDAPAVDAVEVTAQEIQFLIDAMYHHVRWMIAGRLDKPECSYDERVALLERLTLFEREHFLDMKAETEG